jgi:hypothetical protein
VAEQVVLRPDVRVHALAGVLENAHSGTLNGRTNLRAGLGQPAESGSGGQRWVCHRIEPGEAWQTHRWIASQSLYPIGGSQIDRTVQERC